MVPARDLLGPLKIPARAVMRRLAARSVSRAMVNAIYGRLNPRQQEVFFLAFGQVFAAIDSGMTVDAGDWTVRFAGTQLRLPLRPDQIKLDWDLALSVVGNDFEVKESYAELLGRPNRPDLFLDIGGNFGTHSLLFLTHGVRTITFEPNPHCHAYFLQSCAMNGVVPQLEKVALGEAPGPAELSFPEGETWLGTIDETEKARLSGVRGLVSTSVECRRLDDYLPEIAGAGRILMKIDTEGSECAVLRGAERTLTLNPLIVFEMLPDPALRAQVFDLLTEAGYAATRLPWRSNTPLPSLRKGDFLAATELNFAAVPRRPSAWLQAAPP